VIPKAVLGYLAWMDAATLPARPRLTACALEREQVLTGLVANGLMVDQPLQWPQGSTWQLDGANGRFTHARYLSPCPLPMFPITASSQGAEGPQHLPERCPESE
jgi:hypothetical protein